MYSQLGMNYIKFRTTHYFANSIEMFTAAAIFWNVDTEAIGHRQNSQKDSTQRGATGNL